MSSGADLTAFRNLNKSVIDRLPSATAASVTVADVSTTTTRTFSASISGAGDRSTNRTNRWPRPSAIIAPRSERVNRPKPRRFHHVVASMPIVSGAIAIPKLRRPRVRTAHRRIRLLPTRCAALLHDRALRETATLRSWPREGCAPATRVAKPVPSLRQRSSQAGRRQQVVAPRRADRVRTVLQAERLHDAVRNRSLSCHEPIPGASRFPQADRMFPCRSIRRQTSLEVIRCGEMRSCIPQALEPGCDNWIRQIVHIR